MKKKTIKIPIYFGQFIIILDNENWENVNKIYCKKLKWDRPADEGDDAFVFGDIDNGFSKYIVAFKSNPTGKIIAHDCVHLVNKLFKDRGIELYHDNDEAYAYMLAWFFEQIENFFKSK